MPVSHQLKAIFVHIPKNAGESIEKKLGMYGNGGNLLDTLWGVRGNHVLQHLTMAQIGSMYLPEEVVQGYFKFAFIRNPWDKAVSEYHWYLRYGAPVSFLDWVRSLESRVSRRENLHVLEIGHNIPQHEFIYQDGKDLLVDYVGRFERLQADFDHVCRMLGVADSMLYKDASTASSGRRGYREYYNKESRDIISRLYMKDIDLFGYRFD